MQLELRVWQRMFRVQALACGLRVRTASGSDRILPTRVIDDGTSSQSSLIDPVATARGSDT